jgi:aminopeptidase N
MFNRALTRDEAVERARLLDVESYDIALDLTGCDQGATTFGSSTVVTFRCREPGGTTFAEWRSSEESKAFLNGRQVSIEDGRITLDALQPRNELVVTGRGVYSTAGEGLHRAVDPADGATYVYSMCFLHEASRVFGCFDQPDLKAVLRVQVTAPDGWSVVSNSAADGSDGGFAVTPRLPTYLMAVAAGPYAHAQSVWTDPTSGRRVPLGLYCRKSLEPHLSADELFEVTQSGLDFFTRTFGVPMPFEKYDQLFAPEFNAGAMENPGLVIHMDELLYRSAVSDDQLELRALIVLHEMAHMWFGDLVSMRWWDDLWLNESFAEFCGYLATAECTRHRDAWTSFGANDKANARSGDLRPSSHPVSALVQDTDAALLNFDAISYNKGASLLRQLLAFVGRDTFFRGVRNYFLEHSWGNTELADLLEALEAVSGRDLKSWGEQHLRTAGVPTWRPEVGVTEQGILSALTLHQSGTLTHQLTRVGEYVQTRGILELRDAIQVEVQGERTDVPQMAGRSAPDLLLFNDDDSAYAQVELDNMSLQTLQSTGVSALDDSLARGVAWGALFDMVHETTLPAARFVELVSRDIGRESHAGLLTRLVRRSDVVSSRYAPSAEVAGLRTDLAAACAAGGRAEGLDAGRRLALVRGHTLFATSDEQLAQLGRRLDGAGTQDGVDIDADLRWQVLTRLVACGSRGAPDIDAESARDATAFGRHKAEAARAALPDRAAKERAWLMATARSTSTNRLVSSACAGFWQLDQLDLCRPFVERYFAELDRLWGECDVEISHVVTRTLYPSLLVEAETLERTDEHLARADLPAGQRRILKDMRYDLERALAAREAWSPH